MTEEKLKEILRFRTYLKELKDLVENLEGEYDYNNIISKVDFLTPFLGDMKMEELTQRFTLWKRELMSLLRAAYKQKLKEYEQL